jgi:O-antigen/teichoic acid export membrane protein
MIAPTKSKLFRNTIFLSSTLIGGRLIRFLYMLIIARLLGPDETGIYLYGIALYLSVIGIGNLGQSVFLAQRLGKHKSTPYPVLHHSLTLTLLATLLVAALLALFVWCSESDPTVRLAVMCFVGALVARVIASWVRVAYVALERPGWIPKYELVFRGLEALTGVVILLSGGGLLAVSFLHFLFWTIEAGFALRKMAREDPGALGLGCRWNYLKKATIVSVVFLTSITAIALFPQVSIIMLRKLQPDGDIVGYFGIAMQFMTTLMIVPMAVSLAFLPRLSRSYSRGDGGQDLVTAVKLVGLLALSGAIAAAAYGPWFIDFVLGPKYAESANLFRGLCWVLTPYAVTILIGQSLNVIGGRAKSVLIMVLMTTIHAGLLAFYVERSPIIAAVGSMLLAALIGMLLALHQMTRKLGLEGHLWWWKSIFVMTATYIVFESGWASLEFTAPIALLAGALLTWKLEVFDNTDVAAIQRVLGRVSTDN